MISKFIGLVIMAITLSIVYLYETSASASGRFHILHWPAILLTGIGPFGLVLLCSDWQLIRRTFRLLSSETPATKLKRHEEETSLLPKISQDFYNYGAKSLESLKVSHLSPYFQRTIERLSMRIPTTDVRNLLERERERDEVYLTQSVNIVALGVRLAPSVGMLGTILGMVQLLSSLTDPSHIGSHMSLALLTTFYGLFFSLILWTPFQQRLERLLDSELNAFDHLLHWLELLEKRKPAQYLVDPERAEEKLPLLPGTHLSPQPG